MISPIASFESDRINEDALLKCVNKPATAMWFATAVDLPDRAVSQVEGAINFENEIVSAKEENKNLLTD